MAGQDQKEAFLREVNSTNEDKPASSEAPPEKRGRPRGPNYERNSRARLLQKRRDIERKLQGFTASERSPRKEKESVKKEAAEPYDPDFVDGVLTTAFGLSSLYGGPRWDFPEDEMQKIQRACHKVAEKKIPDWAIKIQAELALLGTVAIAVGGRLLAQVIEKRRAKMEQNAGQKENDSRSERERKVNLPVSSPAGG